MAGIDKMYLTKAEVDEFLSWIIEMYDDCYYKTGGCSIFDHIYKGETNYITNFPEIVDWYLWHYCPLLYIQDRLHEQYRTKEPANELQQITDEIISKWGDKAQEFMKQLSDIDTTDLFSWALFNRFPD
jgi:hypothetical protein